MGKHPFVCPRGSHERAARDKGSNLFINYFKQTASLEALNYQYDTRGRLSSVTHGSAGTATLSYDAQGNLASLTDTLGRLTRYQYDLAARLTQQTLPDGRFINYSYDANGNVTGITPPGRPNHAFAYTPMDLEQQYTPPTAGLPTPQTRYAYNLDKQLTRVTRPDAGSLRGLTPLR